MRRPSPQGDADRESEEKVGRGGGRGSGNTPYRRKRGNV